MTGPIEADGVERLARHDLRGRPPFKLAIQERDGRWYLYLAHFWHSGWSILDVTDPRDPAFVRFLEGPENTMTLQVQVADGTMVTSLEKPRENWGPIGGPRMDPDRAFETGAYLWDVASDPESPELVGHWDCGGGGTHRNHYHGGTFAYMTANPDGFDGKMLVVLDVSEPSEPTEVGRWWYPGQAPGETAGSDIYLHGPAYPNAEETRAYASYGPHGMIVLDITDKSDPRKVGQVAFGDLGSGLGVHSAVPLPDSEFVVANSEAIQESSPLANGDPLNYVFVVDVSEEGDPRFEGMTPRGPKVVSSFPLPRPGPGTDYDNYYQRGRFGPHNQHHYQYQDDHRRLTDVVPMTYFAAGLRLFDVSDPLQPEEVGWYVPEDPDEPVNDLRPSDGETSQLEDVLVDDRGYIYCSDPNRGLFVLEADAI